MMHPSSNVNSSTNLYDPSRALDDYYYYNYSSPSFSPSSPSLHHHYSHKDGSDNIEADFFQDFLENHQEMIQQQQNSLEIYSSNTKKSNNNKDNNDESSRVGIKKIGKEGKKISKKDRHTKIETAQGPRDRRMRLSLNIARRFFDLQDMLGFDKASKTVEWLLTKSISAITELSTSSFHQRVCANSSLSSTSEIVMDELSSTHGNLEKGMLNKKTSAPKKRNKKVVRSFPPINKKSRKEARERARERTKEKKQKRRALAGATKVVGHGTSFLGSGYWIPSSTYLYLQQNDGIINGFTSAELEHLSGNLDGASIW